MKKPKPKLKRRKPRPIRKKRTYSPERIAQAKAEAMQAKLDRDFGRFLEGHD